MMSIRGTTRAGIVVLLASSLVLIGATFAGVRYTSQPGFCASCHEMQAVHRGWSKGSHAATACNECHVEQTFAGQVRAKINGLRQVYTHFTRTVDLKQVKARVPGVRCARCHDMSRAEKLGARIVLAHRKHEEAELECTVCHFTSAHSRELFAGFQHDSCKECHSAAREDPTLSYLRRIACSRE